MGAYDSIIDFYSNQAKTNAAENAALKASFFQTMNNAASFARQYRNDQLANQTMNQMDPPRATAVSPTAAPTAPGADGQMYAMSPEESVAAYNASYGTDLTTGGTRPHTGGVDELEMVRAMRKDELAEDVARSRMDNERMRVDIGMRKALGGGIERALTPQQQLNYDQDIENAELRKFEQGLLLHTGLSLKDAARIQVAPDQNGVSTGKMRIVIPPKMNEWGMEIGEPQIKEIPKGLMDLRDQYANAWQGGLPAEPDPMAMPASATQGRVIQRNGRSYQLNEQTGEFEEI
jgi:hypothetical protein